MISALRETPLNANQLAKELGLNYKAIQHHLGVLEKNNMITRVGEKYGATFFLSALLEANIETFDQIMAKLHMSKQRDLITNDPSTNMTREPVVLAR